LADAVELASKDIERFPDDAVRHVWLANLLVRDNRPQEAVDILRAATARFPNDGRVWNALFVVLAQDGQNEEARRTLDALVTGTLLPQESRHFVAAQGFEALGDVAEAKKQYELAIASQPNEIAVRLRFAKFVLANDTEVARTQYEKVLAQDPNNSEARRELANLLSASGQDADWERAKRLLERQGDESAVSAATNDRLRAMLLAQQGRTRSERIANCQAASQILQQLIAVGGAAEGDINRLLLVRVLEQEANLSGDRSLLFAAREQLRHLVEEKNPSQQNLLLYLGFLLRHATAGATETLAQSAVDDSPPDEQRLKEEFLHDAESRLKDLGQVAADGGEKSDTLASLALTVRLLQARGRTEEAADRLADYVERQSGEIQNGNGQAQLYLMAGGLYTTLGRPAEAEKWYRRLMEIAPNAYVLVVQSLMAQEKHGEAAELCLNLSKGKPTPDEAVVLTNVMAGMDDSDEQLPKVRSAIQAAIENNRNNIKLLQAEGVMWASRGDYDQAIASLRRVIEIAPNNSLALNNLATLLAERPNQLAEALQYIDRAIEVSGRQASLLDTQGTIFLKTGESPQAIACLEEATAGGAADARYYLHLAAAYHQAARNDDARRALKASRDFGLEKFVLTDDDRKLLAKLDRELVQPKLSAEIN
jgi:tetratricopeptide (TPR) repeat protein